MTSIENGENSSIDFNQMKLDRSSDVVEFWSYISKLKKGDDSPMFPLRTILVTNIMTLPHSSAHVERIFSMVNAIKTKERNRLQTDSLCGLLQSKHLLKTTNTKCYNHTFNDYLKKFKLCINSKISAILFF